MACLRTSPPADCYLQFAHELRAKCHRLSHINGASKLERKILAEVKFLKNAYDSHSMKIAWKRDVSMRSSCYDRCKLTLLQKNSEVQESHLRSSNLSHFAAIVHAAENLPGAVEILQPFPCQGKNESLVVDVVAGQGHIWVKVIARKAQALHLVWAGQGQFGERDLLHQSEDYLDSARQHPHIYTTPDVCFIFFNNVTYSMAKALRDKGVKVLGHEVPVDENIEHKLMDLHTMLDLEGSEDDLETASCMMSARGFVESCGKYREEKGKRQDPHSRYQHLHRENKEDITLEQSTEVTESETSDVSVAPEVDAVSSSLSGEISLSTKEVILSETKLPAGSDVGNSLSHGTSADIASLSGNIDNSISTTSASHVSGVPDFRETEEVVYPDVPSIYNPGDSKKHTKSDVNSEEHETLLKLPQIKLACQTESAISKGTHCHTEKLETSDVSYEKKYTSVPSSANYQMLTRELLGVIPDIASSLVDHSWEIINSISKVNLDITTLITLVSAVTHGHCNYVFTEHILTMQAGEEREKPVLPDLMQFMKGKELYACRSAVDDFNTILATLGGEGEKQRAQELLARVNVIDDNPSQKALKLKNLGKIKDRSKTIFGTGDCLKAITMTANCGFLRAAKGQGVSFAVFVHAARALTEDKERTATPI